MSESDSPFDPGLQPERTLLAWRRSCLALAVASAVVVSFAGESLGASAALLGVAGLATAAAAYVRAARRYRRAHEGLTSDGQLPIDGIALALMTLSLLLICSGAVAYVAGVGVGRLAAG